MLCAWAEQVICAAADCATKPPRVAWADAAVFPVAALTAEQVVTGALAVQPGETVRVHGAGGVIGNLIVQLATVRGARVIATVGPASADRVRAVGAVEVLDYHDAHWTERVRALTGGVGAAAAAAAARGGAAQAFAAVANGGRLATITSDSADAGSGVTVHQVDVRPDGARLAALAELPALAELLALAELPARGELTVEAGPSYPFEQGRRTGPGTLRRERKGNGAVSPLALAFGHGKSGDAAGS